MFTWYNQINAMAMPIKTPTSTSRHSQKKTRIVCPIGGLFVAAPGRPSGGVIWLFARRFVVELCLYFLAPEFLCLKFLCPTSLSLIFLLSKFLLFSYLFPENLQLDGVDEPTVLFSVHRSVSQSEYMNQHNEYNALRAVTTVNYEPLAITPCESNMLNSFKTLEFQNFKSFGSP
jgi:hypothetical protein